MLLRNHTGLIKWPLVASAGGVHPTITQGDLVKFSLKDLPIASKNLPNYLAGIALEISGNYNIPTTSDDLSEDLLAHGFIDNVRLENCWHGTPISDSHWKGWALDWLEFLHNGYNPWGPKSGMFSNLGSARPFVKTILLPLGFFMGDKPHHTAQLALFYKNAELTLQTQAASVLTGLATGIAFTSLKMRATALLLPDAEIRIGPGTSHVFYRDPRAVAQEVINLDSFGNTTTLEGVELGAGIAALNIMMSAAEQSAPVAASSITDFGWSARGQKRHKAVRTNVCELLDAIGGHGSRSRQTIDIESNSMTGMPFTQSHEGGDAALGGDPLNDALRVFPLIVARRELETTKLQVFEGSTSFELVENTGSGGNTWHVQASQFHSWTPQKLEDGKREIIQSGLPSVLGLRGDLNWQPKVTRKQAFMDPRKVRFLPMKLTGSQPT